jgi:hypothetical protein
MRIVEGFMGIPTNPISPAVTKRGKRFGIRETIII